MSFSIAFGTIGYWLVFVALFCISLLTFKQTIKNHVRKKALKGQDYPRWEFWISMVITVVVMLIPYYNIFALFCQCFAYLFKDNIQKRFDEKYGK